MTPIESRPFNPFAKQLEAMEILTDQVTEFLGYGGGGGGGKTYLGCWWLMQMGYYAPGTKYFIGRDSLKDTRESVLQSWRKLSKSIGFTQWKYTDNHILFDNGSEIEFLDLTLYPQKDPLYERFGSKEYTCGWIEEAGPVNFLAFDVLKTRIGRWLNKEYNIKKKILCTFNPKKNWVETTFYRPFKNGTETQDTKFIFSLAKDNPEIPDDYIETLRNLKDEATRQRLLYGNFDYDDDPSALIRADVINNLFDNEFIVPTNDHYLTADIARFGSDKAVLMAWHGLVIVEVVTFDTCSMTVLQDAITAMRIRHRIVKNNCIADEDGVGGGVIDNLGIKGFQNGSKAFDAGYEHLKAECGYKLADVVHEMRIMARIDEKMKETIKQELGQLKTYKADNDKKLRILPKDKIKENINRSPDYLDNFIMRMWWLVSEVVNDSPIRGLAEAMRKR